MDNVKDFYNGTAKIIEGFKNRLFLLIIEDFHSDNKRLNLSATSGSSIDKSQALMIADIKEQYNKLLN